MNSASEKALAALEAAGKAATPRPWRSGVDALECSKCDEDVGVGASVVAEKATDVCFTYANPVENADLIALAVNLSAPLAAVARAAMAYREAMSFRRTKNSESDYVEWSRAVNDENLAQAELFAALDALEAAAEGVV